MEPSTVYGISKQAGERWCEYYHNIFYVDAKYSLSVNQLFFTQVAERQIMPLVFHKALSDKKYECFYPRKPKCP
jgi:nucleoside-diphosphate-sugar epimerase